MAPHCGLGCYHAAAEITAETLELLAHGHFAMITIDVDATELQRLIDALTIACEAYGRRGMDAQAISFELLRDKLEALQSDGDDYSDDDDDDDW